MYDGFLFVGLTWEKILMWCVVLLGLIVANELARRSKWIALFSFVALPIILPFTVWSHTAGADSSTGTWFHWVKVYSALAGCLGFMYIRYNKSAVHNRYWLMFPPAILAINIMEAVMRDFQCYTLYSGADFGKVVNEVTMMGGSWNIMNGIAGLINIITISGWMGIFITKGKTKDMLWPDMLWMWIIAYDIWNFAYVYNCVGDHAFYAGAALLISCTIPAFFIKKGAWLQHRAQTLAFWMMFTMSFPTFVDFSPYAVKSSNSPTALFIISALALLSNVAVLGYHFYKIVVYKRNPLKQEIYIDEPKYIEVANERK